MYQPTQIRQRIGIFGGTFDPIHLGHLIIAQEAVLTCHLDLVLFIPTGQPPHKHDHAVTRAEDRATMVELAIATNPIYALSRIEVDRDGPSYTVDTLHLLHEAYQHTADFYLILGGDMVDSLHLWHDPQGVVDQVAGIIGIERPGTKLKVGQKLKAEDHIIGLSDKLHTVGALHFDISSSFIRQRCTEGLPIRYLVTDTVLAYVTTHHLYHIL